MNTIKDLTDYYLKSDDYKRLGISSIQYKYLLGRINTVPCSSYDYFGNTPLNELTNASAQITYDYVATAGRSIANHSLAVIRKAFNHAIKYDKIKNNPFTTVSTLPTEHRKTVWLPSHVKKFLHKAYEDFNTRNVGLIVQMAYEFAQRVGDMRTLEWDNIDFGKQVLNLVQSKRRALVHIPISDATIEMLTQQEKDFGFQKYVVPYVYKDKTIRPYSIAMLSRKARKIIEVAGLPGNLQLRDLRRTATTEMAEAGVELPQIMSVTGHVNPSSVTPYLKNTLTSAKNACRLRSEHTGRV